MDVVHSACHCEQKELGICECRRVDSSSPESTGSIPDTVASVFQQHEWAWIVRHSHSLQCQPESLVGMRIRARTFELTCETSASSLLFSKWRCELEHTNGLLGHVHPMKYSGARCTHSWKRREGNSVLTPARKQLLLC